jgi:hypothetical protein
MSASVPDPVEVTKIQRERAQRANSRRVAFRRFMLENSLTPSEWARKAGMPTPNTIYNFLNGQTAGLSQDTLRRLADAIPNTLVSDLIGETVVKGIVRTGGPTVARVQHMPVSIEAKYGYWKQRNYTVHRSKQESVSVVEIPKVSFDDAIVVRDNTCDELYPVGSYLMISHVEETHHFKTRDAVAVLRSRNRTGIEEYEVTIREVDNNRLVWRTTMKDLVNDVVRMPDSGATEFFVPASHGMPEFDYQILGVVQFAVLPARRHN